MRKKFSISSIDCTIWYYDEDGSLSNLECSGPQVDYVIERMGRAEGFIKKLKETYDSKTSGGVEI